MPKSKRNKQIELAKTKKRGLEWKKHLFEEVRSCVDSYSNIFVFSVNDMRNSKMKTVREQWKHSRFFIGKNKIMAMALGRFAEEEYKPNLHKIGQRIKGQRGLLFSNKSTEEVLSWFRSYSEGDFARSGNSATEDIKLAAGPLPQFPHSLEPYLRQLGLPTSLVKGVIHLVKDHEVCKAGDILTPETAKIIKLLGYEMAEFHFTIVCMWSQDGTFMQFTEEITDAKENKQRLLSHTKVAKTCSSPDVEEMDIEDSESKIAEVSLNTPKTSSKPIKPIQTNQNKASPKLTNMINKFIIPDVEKKEETECLKNTHKKGKKKRVENTSEEVSTPKRAIQEIERNASTEILTSKTSTPKEKIIDLVENIESEDECSILLTKNEETEGLKMTPEMGKQEKTEKISEDANTEKAAIKEIDLMENVESEDECPILVAENGETQNVKNPAPKTGKKKRVGKVYEEKNVNEEDEESDNRPSRSRKRKIKVNEVVSKQDSLPRTPDNANISQDSPIFRELRNRSVKMSRKRK